MEHVTPCQNVPKRREKQVELVLLGKNHELRNEILFEICSKIHPLDSAFVVYSFSIQQVPLSLKTVPTSKTQTFLNLMDRQALFHGRLKSVHHVST